MYGESLYGSFPWQHPPTTVPAPELRKTNTHEGEKEFRFELNRALAESLTTLNPTSSVSWT